MDSINVQPVWGNNLTTGEPLPGPPCTGALVDPYTDTESIHELEAYFPKGMHEIVLYTCPPRVEISKSMSAPVSLDL